MDFIPAASSSRMRPWRPLASPHIRKLVCGLRGAKRLTAEACGFAGRGVRSAPDGYTLLLAASPNAINASLYDKLSFNFIRDIAPVSQQSPCQR
jgi:hypothetical protein